MGSKRKIIVASIIAVFAILIAVTAITITLALTYQTIETAIVVEFTASEVDAEINAKTVSIPKHGASPTVSPLPRRLPRAFSQPLIPRLLRE